MKWLDVRSKRRKQSFNNITIEPVYRDEPYSKSYFFLLLSVFIIWRRVWEWNNAMQ